MVVSLPGRAWQGWRGHGRPGRPDFVSGDWFTGTAEEYEAEATSYIAYSGQFHVDEDEQSVAHSVLVSLFPNWVGRTQLRRLQLEGDMLHLSTASPIRSGGRTVHVAVVWRRAEPADPEPRRPS
ncbi:lipocalin-like domain-containing protein [Georgenia sp. AZ-5]|uniref:lipocalin-like domain-containing protein n=1 Tax=Georgenia sp. AZ-5 TaxID=3367526 RepID=UPI00375518AD